MGKLDTSSKQFLFALSCGGVFFVCGENNFLFGESGVSDSVVGVVNNGGGEISVGYKQVGERLVLVCVADNGSLSEKRYSFSVVSRLNNFSVSETFSLMPFARKELEFDVGVVDVSKVEVVKRFVQDDMLYRDMLYKVLNAVANRGRIFVDKVKAVGAKRDVILVDNDEKYEAVSFLLDNFKFVLNGVNVVCSDSLSGGDSYLQTLRKLCLVANAGGVFSAGALCVSDFGYSKIISLADCRVSARVRGGLLSLTTKGSKRDFKFFVHRKFILREVSKRVVELESFCGRHFVSISGAIARVVVDKNRLVVVSRGASQLDISVSNGRVCDSLLYKPSDLIIGVVSKNKRLNAGVRDVMAGLVASGFGSAKVFFKTNEVLACEHFGVSEKSILDKESLSEVDLLAVLYLRAGGSNFAWTYSQKIKVALAIDCIIKDSDFKKRCRFLFYYIVSGYAKLLDFNNLLKKYEQIILSEREMFSESYLKRAVDILENLVGFSYEALDAYYFILYFALGLQIKGNVCIFKPNFIKEFEGTKVRINSNKSHTTFVFSQNGSAKPSSVASGAVDGYKKFFNTVAAARVGGMTLTGMNSFVLDSNLPKQIELIVV
ncbi:MAG: hypothetical protein FWB72_06680 [Firmicutes bacterium]|nr:hypothetical protein [Bacillota bacterium]